MASFQAKTVRERLRMREEKNSNQKITQNSLKVSKTTKIT